MRRCYYLIVFFCYALCWGGKLAEGFTGAFSLADSGRIIDQKGRVIEPGRSFKRIISLYGAHTENLFFMGAENEVVGVSMGETYPPDALKKDRFSYKDDPEKFLAAVPDLILIRPMIDRAYSALFSRLETMGVAVLSLQPGTVAEMRLYLRILGRVSGKEKEADAMIQAFDRSLAYIETVSGAIPLKKRVYLEAIHSHMKTFSKESITAFVLERAGGDQVGREAVPSRDTNIANYGKERILSRGEEIEVFIAQSGKMNPVTLETILNEPGFGTIKAVKSRQVYLIDEEIVSRPTFRLIGGIFEMGRLIYPDRFTPEVKKKLDEIGRVK